MNKSSDKKSLSIQDVQSRLSELETSLRIEFTSLTKREKDVLLKTVKLQEEVGELANDILAVLSLQRKSKLEAFEKANLYEEFADVFLAVSSLANALRVNMNRAVTEKLDKLQHVYSKDR